eukprot:TCALIF_11354-PA protein Name:"Similar to SMYD3 Histone-lysine N-methyltransferase SMYD3 (Homo sapiens)" AED:0.01 eAED:0.01 QI:0/1/0.5/1/1/1/2/151/458
MFFQQENLKPGSLIVKCEPFAYILSQKLSDVVCDSCLRRSTSALLKCASCKHVRYCDKRCQRNGWTDHKHECQYIAKIQPRVPPDTIRLIARIVIKLRNGGAKIQGQLPDGQKRTFFDLEPHHKEILEDKQKMAAFNEYFKVLQHFMPQDLPSKDDIWEIFCRTSINSFNLMDDDYTSQGIGLYLEASIFDHSCEPNAFAVFQGKTLEVRYIGPNELPGPVNCSQDIRISYCSPLKDTPTRQKILRESYYFTCHCSKCNRDPDTLDLYKNGSLKCAKCGKAVPIPKEIRPKNLKCRQCHFEVTPEKLKDFSLSKQILTKLSDSLVREERPLSKSGLAVIHSAEEVVHPYDLTLLVCLEKASLAELDHKDFRAALKTSLAQMKAYQFYYPSFHVNMGVVHMRIGKLASHLGHIKFASQHLEKAEEQLFITHGSNHTLYQRDLVPLLRDAHQELRNFGAQ